MSRLENKLLLLLLLLKHSIFFLTVTVSLRPVLSDIRTGLTDADAFRVSSGNG